MTVPTRLRVKALTAVNEVPRYADCAPWYLRFWRAVSSRALHDFEPVLIKIEDSRSGSGVRLSDGVTSLLIEESEISTAFAAQCVRLLWPGTIDADLVLISDVDMLPLSSRVFDGAIARMRATRADVCIVRDVLGPGQIAMCYVMATPAAWRILFPESVKAGLTQWWSQVRRGGYAGHNGPNWCFDQETLYARVTDAESSGRIQVLRLKDHVTGHRRLDRTKHPARMIGPWAWLIRRGSFTDYHVHLPVGDHEDFLREVLAAIAPTDGCTI